IAVNIEICAPSCVCAKPSPATRNSRALDQLEARMEHRAWRVIKPAALVAQYSALVVLLSSTQTPQVATDPDDDHVIACALAARADIIVSGRSASARSAPLSGHPHRQADRGVRFITK